MESIFDTKEIAKRVEEFFAMYEDTRGSTYDMCEAKIIHSRMVAANCKFIAKSLGFDAYDIDLAWIIGELHDFARFGQIVVTHTFKDTEASTMRTLARLFSSITNLSTISSPTTIRCPKKTGRS